MPAPLLAFNQVELSLYGSGFNGAPPSTDLAPVASGIASIGATWVRILMDWKLIETAPGTYNWSYMDAALDAVTSAGLNVLLVPNDAPFWSYTPTLFADFVRTAVQRYGPGGSHTLAKPVRTWEIWNEPNYIFGYPPGGNGATGMYAYQKAAYDAIHAADSGAFVISAGLIPVYNGWGTVDAVTWLTSMYAAVPPGSPAPWDGVGYHPYPGDPSGAVQEPTPMQYFIAEIPQLYQVMKANSDALKPLWFTEFGFQTQPSGVAGGSYVTPAVQAQWLLEEIATLQTVVAAAGATTGPMFLYNYRNSLADNGAANGQYGMGVVKFDFTHQPSWAAIQTLISGGAPVGVTSGGTIIKPSRPTITMSGTGPSGVTVGGMIIKPAPPTITMSGTTATGVATAMWGALGIALNPVAVPMDSFQSLTDELVGVAGSSLNDLTAVLKSIEAAAGSAGQTANAAAGNLVSLITGLVGSAEAEIEALIASLNGTASTSSVNTNQIAALWAHVSAASTAGIRYLFSSSVPLTDNYPGTSHPSWSAAGPLSLPSVPSGENYVATSAGAKGMVFTGNPTGAASDHGLITDRNQVYATLKDMKFGTADLFMTGHYSGGTLGQNLVLELGYGGPAALRFYVCTGAMSFSGPGTGKTQVGTQWDLPNNPKDTDVIGMQHDGAGNYTMYYNNVPVGSPWVNGTGATLTLGAGYRECGLIVFDSGQLGIGLAEFVALDYV